MTDRSVSDTSSGTSTGTTPGQTLWSPKLGRAILYRAAKDIRTATDWLASDHIKTYCEHSGVDHGQYCAAVEYIARANEVQKPLLLRSLKKALRVK